MSTNFSDIVILSHASNVFRWGWNLAAAETFSMRQRSSFFQLETWTARKNVCFRASYSHRPPTQVSSRLPVSHRWVEENNGKTEKQKIYQLFEEGTRLHILSCCWCGRQSFGLHVYTKPTKEWKKCVFDTQYLALWESFWKNYNIYIMCTAFGWCIY